MLNAAGDKADSIDPLAVAKTLEGFEYDAAGGHLTMRAEDHQLQMPLYLSVLKDNMKHGAEGTDYNFHQVARFVAVQATLPTTCRMRRPD